MKKEAIYTLGEKEKTKSLLDNNEKEEPYTPKEEKKKAYPTEIMKRRSHFH